MYSTKVMGGDKDSSASRKRRGVDSPLGKVWYMKDLLGVLCDYNE